MRPPANGKAGFSLDADLVDKIPSSNLASVLAYIKVGGLSSQSRRSFLWRRAKETSCSLQILVNDATVYLESLVISDGHFDSVISSSLEASNYLKLEMIQECGNEPVKLIVAGALIENDGSNAQLPGPTATDYADGGRNPF